MLSKITLSPITEEEENTEKDQNDKDNEADDSYGFDRVELKETNIFSGHNFISLPNLSFAQSWAKSTLVW